jgi:hypothetical protein
VLNAVLRHHSNQQWVLERLRHLLVAALSGGRRGLRRDAADDRRRPCGAGRTRRQRPGVLASVHSRALAAAAALGRRRGANDSWGNHRRRMTAIMELYALVCATASRRGPRTTPSRRCRRFAGFQAPARLREADGLRACRMDRATIDKTLQAALQERTTSRTITSARGSPRAATQ